LPRQLSRPAHPLLAWPLAILLLMLSLAACANPLDDLQEPTFRLAGIEPLALGMADQRFRLTIEVDNPNDLSLPIRHLEYQLQLADIDFASGQTDQGFTLAALEKTTFEVDVNTRLMSSLPQLMRMIDPKAGSVNYLLSGDVEYGRYYHGSRYFEQKGQVRFTQ